MLLTFLVDPPLLLFIGAVFALAVPVMVGPVPRRAPGLTRAWWHGLALVTCFNAAVAFAYQRYPDWMWGYFFDTATFPRWQHLASLLVVLLAYYLLFHAGYLAVLERRAQRRSARSVLGIVGAATLLTMIVGRARFGMIGEYVAFHHGDAVPLWQSALARDYLAGVIVLVLLGVGLLWCAWRSR